MNEFPVGKLPAEMLARLLAQRPIQDPRVLLGPGIGLDCAVIEAGQGLLVLKSDPITFATDAIGWYAVQVNANDILTTGAIPRWFLATLLLPEGKTSPELVERINDQIQAACQDLNINLVGGHTEITSGLDRPILVGTLIGEVSHERLITPRGALPGDRLLLSKGVPIEATALLAREFPERLRRSGALSEDEIHQAQVFLYNPGISVAREAMLAIRAGVVHAMHDPTEGGLYTALWELAEACGCSMLVDLSHVPIPELSARICRILGLDPMAAIASGALLFAVPAGEAPKICAALQANSIRCAEIGQILDQPGPPTVWHEGKEQRSILQKPSRDAIAALYEERFLREDVLP